MYSNTPLHTALRARGLDNRNADNKLMLTQDGRDIGLMSAYVGWCLIRLYDGVSTDEYPRNVVKEARRLLAGVNRPVSRL